MLPSSAKLTSAIFGIVCEDAANGNNASERKIKPIDLLLVMGSPAPESRWGLSRTTSKIYCGLAILVDQSVVLGPARPHPQYVQGEPRQGEDVSAITASDLQWADSDLLSIAGAILGKEEL